MKFIPPKVLTLVCVLAAVLGSLQLDTSIKKLSPSRKALMIPNHKKTIVSQKIMAHPIKDFLEHQRKNQSVKKGVRRFKADVNLPNKNFTKFMKITSFKRNRKNLALLKSKVAAKSVPAVAQLSKSSTVQRRLNVQPSAAGVVLTNKAVIKGKSTELDQVFDELKSLENNLHQIKATDVNAITKKTQDKLIDVLNKYKEVLQESPTDKAALPVKEAPPSPRALMSLDSGSKVSKKSSVDPKVVDLNKKKAELIQKITELPTLKLQASKEANMRQVQPLVPKRKTQQIAETPKSKQLPAKKASLVKNEAKASVKKMEDAIDTLKDKLQQLADSKKIKAEPISVKKESTPVVKPIASKKAKKVQKSKKKVARKAKIVPEKKKATDKKSKATRKLGKTVHKIDRTSTTLVTIKISKPPKNVSFLNSEADKPDFYKYKNKSFKVSVQISSLRFMLQKLNTCYERVHEIQIANHDASLFSVECRDELIIVLRAIVELKKWGKSIIYRYIVSNTNVRTLGVLDHELRLPRPISVSKLSVPFSSFYSNLRSHYSQFRLTTYARRYERQSQSLVQFYDQIFSKNLSIIQEMAKSLEYTHAMSAVIEFNHEVQIFKQVNILIEEHKHGIIHESSINTETENSTAPVTQVNCDEKPVELTSGINLDQLINQFSGQQGEFNGQVIQSDLPHVDLSDEESEPIVHKVIYSPKEWRGKKVVTKKEEEETQEDTDETVDSEEAVHSSKILNEPVPQKSDEQVETDDDTSTDASQQTDDDGEAEENTPITPQTPCAEVNQQETVSEQAAPITQLDNFLSQPLNSQQSELSRLKSLIENLQEQMRSISAQLPTQEKTLEDKIRENEKKVKKSLSDPESLKEEEEELDADEPVAKKAPEDNKQAIVISSPFDISDADKLDKIKIAQQNPDGKIEQITPIVIKPVESKPEVDEEEDEKPNGPNVPQSGYNVMTPDQKMKLFSNLLKQISSQNSNGQNNFAQQPPSNTNEQDEDDSDENNGADFMSQFRQPTIVPKFPFALNGQKINSSNNIPPNEPININRPQLNFPPKINGPESVPAKKGLFLSTGPYNPHTGEPLSTKPVQNPVQLQYLPKVNPVNATNIPRPNNGSLQMNNQAWRTNSPGKVAFDNYQEPSQFQSNRPTPQYNRFTGQPDGKIHYKPITDEETHNLSNIADSNNRLNNIQNIRNVDVKNNYPNPVNKPLLTSEQQPIQTEQTHQPNNGPFVKTLDIKVPFKGSKTDTFDTPTAKIALTVNHIQNGEPKTRFIDNTKAEKAKEEAIRKLAKLNLVSNPDIKQSSAVKAKKLSLAKPHKKPEANSYMSAFGKIKIIEEKRNKHSASKKVLKSNKPSTNKISNSIAKTTIAQKNHISFVKPIQQKKAKKQRALLKNNKPGKKATQPVSKAFASKPSAKKLLAKTSSHVSKRKAVSPSKKITKQKLSPKSNQTATVFKKMNKSPKSSQKPTRKNADKPAATVQQKSKVKLVQESPKQQQSASRRLSDRPRWRIRI
jgi:hypothetical protein